MTPPATYYHATANPAPATAPLAGDVRADLVVVGGGLTGLSAALAAAEAGLNVVLVEAGELGTGASGRNGGQLIPGLRWSAAEIVAEYGEARGRAIVELALGAVELVAARIARHAIACDLKWGHVEAAAKPAHFAAMCRDAEYLSANFGWTSAAPVAAADMVQHVASCAYHGGIYDRRGGHFHPLNYALGLGHAAIAAGARLFTASPALAISDTGGGVTVRTAHGVVDARLAIIAADAWTGELLPELGRFSVPLMNYVVATAPLPGPAALLPSDAAVADSRFVLNYYRLSADGRLIFGGGERYRQSPPPDIGAFVRPFITRLFPQLAGVPITHGWDGVVAVTMNRLPHLGRRGNFLFAHGFSGHGALLTTLAGTVLAEAATGTLGRIDVLSAIGHRPFPGGRLLARPLATLGLAWYALRDRLG